jgi:nitroreductase
MRAGFIVGGRVASEKENMELADVIRKRRSVHEYTSASIDRFMIQSLVDAAIQAPSAMNSQPWAFCVFLDRRRIDDLSNQVKDWLLNQTLQAPSELNQALSEILTDPGFSLLHHASALLLILAKPSANQAVEACCLAAENLLLAARDVGIATCWIGLARPWFDLRSTKLELGLPEAYRVVAPIILGYPKAWPDSPGRQSAEIRWMDGLA